LVGSSIRVLRTKILGFGVELAHHRGVEVEANLHLQAADADHGVGEIVNAGTRTGHAELAIELLDDVARATNRGRKCDRLQGALQRLADFAGKLVAAEEAVQSSCSPWPSHSAMRVATASRDVEYDVTIGSVLSSMPRASTRTRWGAALIVADPAGPCFDAHRRVAHFRDESIYIAEPATKRLSNAAANSCAL
jgi:hypothetical protein